MLKLAVKELAHSLGLRASFLAKTTAGEEGSSGHIHFSLWRDGLNAFAQFGPLGEPGPTLSAVLAGLLDHLAGASLLLNPTINSYKRLVPGFFAPVNASWGLDNRSVALRVIRSEMAARCRIECRRPGADVNPYLALAAMTAATCDGIVRKGRAPAPTAGDASQSLASLHYPHPSKRPWPPSRPTLHSALVSDKGSLNITRPHGPGS